MDIFQENVSVLKNDIGRGNNSEFGRKLGGVSSQNVTNWEGGTSFPNVLMIRKFVDLGINLNWLIAKQGKPYLSQEYEELQNEKQLRMEAEKREKLKDEEIDNLRRKESIYLSMLEKDLPKSRNFNEVYKSSLLDNLDPILAMDLLTRTKFIGRSFVKDLAGNC